MIQFHATPTELIDFIDRCRKKEKLYATLINFDGRAKHKVLAPGDTLSDMLEGRVPDCVALTVKKPSLRAVTQLYDFVGRNPEWFSVELGALAEGTLKESCADFLGQQDEVSKLWRRLTAALRKMLTTGGWVVDADGSVKEYYPSQVKCSNGAKQLQEQGVIMRPLGNTRVFFGESCDHPLLRKARTFDRKLGKLI